MRRLEGEKISRAEGEKISSGEDGVFRGVIRPEEQLRGGQWEIAVSGVWWAGGVVVDS